MYKRKRHVVRVGITPVTRMAVRSMSTPRRMRNDAGGNPQGGQSPEPDRQRFRWRKRLVCTRNECDRAFQARRAGQAVAGFEKARTWLGGGRAGVLLEASDGAAPGRAKIRALAPKVPLVELFSGDELGSALGREHAVHLVLAPGRPAERPAREAAPPAIGRAACWESV